MLDRLVRHGLVLGERVESNRRIVHLSLLEVGHECVKRIETSQALALRGLVIRIRLHTNVQCRRSTGLGDSYSDDRPDVAVRARAWFATALPVMFHWKF
jgi:DNA-binding MarR family transcriptional regulator